MYKYLAKQQYCSNEYTGATLVTRDINTAQKETTPLKVDYVTFKRYIIQ